MSSQVEVAELIRSAHQPSGRRLGLALIGEVPAQARRDAEAVLLDHGQDPVRRLCSLQPAPGKQAADGVDGAWFISRFGHEYTAVICPSGLPDLPVLRAATVASGCELVLA